MDKSVENYKKFIDGLVKKKDGVYSNWVLEKGYPNTEENKNINELLASMSLEQKQILVKMLEDARCGGIHDTLAYMNEMMDNDNLELRQDGVTYPYDRFESMHFDFICRCNGDNWPE